uniref:Plectrovirus spv1-c74 orf 13 transmembrane protein n=1 Tax=Spiroplasma citri TaxID=2133 RepID=Q14PV1_SPICI|nr:plectrovirus spv1-c74 orf 13 transmembrane protein [Spiroplasma citri]
MSLYDYWVQFVNYIIGANAPEFLYVISFVLFIVLFFGMFFKLIQKCGVFKNAKWLN